MKRILIIDKMHESIVPMLEAFGGFEVVYKPAITRDEIMQLLPDFHGLIVRSKTTIDKPLLSQGGKLEFVARAGAGIDKLDVEELNKMKVAILNAPEGNRDALGEHAVGMLLALLNKMYLADDEIRNWLWDREKNRGYEIMGKTVGLIGYGFMGQAFAKRLSGFDCHVIAYDKYKTNYGDQYANEATLETIFKTTDILSIHTPLTEETRAMINVDFLNGFAKEIIILNTARGEILPVKDLLKCLGSGKLKGAALDVLENEKLDTMSEEDKMIYKGLFNNKRVLLTPHVAGWSFESYEKINTVLVMKIKELYGI